MREYGPLPEPALTAVAPLDASCPPHACIASTPYVEEREALTKSRSGLCKSPSLHVLLGIKKDADNCHTCGIFDMRPHTVCGVSRRQPTQAVCGQTLELPTRVDVASSCHTPSKYYSSPPRVCGTKQKCPHVQPRLR